MTTRIKGLLVYLEHDMRTDDVESVTQAIVMLKHVASVTPIPSDLNHCLAVEAAKRDLRNKMWELLK
jgi:hypothetical protein